MPTKVLERCSVGPNKANPQKCLFGPSVGPNNTLFGPSVGQNNTLFGPSVGPNNTLFGPSVGPNTPIFGKIFPQKKLVSKNNFCLCLCQDGHLDTLINSIRQTV